MTVKLSSGTKFVTFQQSRTVSRYPEPEAHGRSHSTFRLVALFAETRTPKHPNENWPLEMVPFTAVSSQFTESKGQTMVRFKIPTLRFESREATVSEFELQFPAILTSWKGPCKSVTPES